MGDAACEPQSLKKMVVPSFVVIVGMVVSGFFGCEASAPSDNTGMLSAPTRRGGSSARAAYAGVLFRPVERFVGNPLPAVLRWQQVREARVLLHFGDRVRFVVLRVRPLDRGRHQVVCATRDEEQRGAVVI